MNKLEELLKRKKELENRIDIIKSFKISMNVGKKPKIVYEERLFFVGGTRMYKKELTNEQNQFFYDFVYAELEKCRDELSLVDEKLDKAATFLAQTND